MHKLNSRPPTSWLPPVTGGGDTAEHTINMKRDT